jgi:hypothetical protein
MNLDCRRRAIAFALPALFAVGAYAQGGPPFRTDDPATRHLSPHQSNWLLRWMIVLPLVLCAEKIFSSQMAKPPEGVASAPIR